VSDTPQLPSVHLLTVHGVGLHDQLANLLRTYQTFRANLTSVEAPLMGEDQIPGWRLVQFEEGAAPPLLKLEPRVEPPPGPDSVGAVYMYEVNYSGFAGVIRENHPIDLTSLFVGLDLAVCAARQRPRVNASSVFGGETRRLAACLQRFSSVLTAATVPTIGLPSIVFRDYIGTFVATFTRFFADIATFALDKNGEQLISTHLDRTITTISAAMKPGDRLVVAAHSLGSVVVHNFVVRQWTAAGARFPDTVVTFGSPIGLLAWIWLFLDFEDMDFGRQIGGGEHYFCWNPVSTGKEARKKLAWVNVVNCVDPIATAFPEAALDLSATAAEIAAGLQGGTIAHRYFGPARVTAVGGSHTEYLNDKSGFLRILLRAAGLASGDPEACAGIRSADENRTASLAVLRTVQWGLYASALATIALYCWAVARQFGDLRTLWVVPVFAWPALTIAFLAFFQRLMLGGPTKRIPAAQIREMRWSDGASWPYRLREMILRGLGRSRDVDPMAPSPGPVMRFTLRVLSFIPSLAAMAVPFLFAAWLTNQWPTGAQVWTSLWTVKAIVAIAVFMLYVVSCAGFEIVRTWRQVLRIL
jgi:hypothetical protein